jgi:hypothetical protein
MREFFTQFSGASSMTFSKPIKILIGVFTLLIELLPFLVTPLFFMFPILMGTVTSLDGELSDGAQGMLALIATLPFILVTPIMMCYSLAHFLAQVFYIIQIVKNKTISDTPRILFILGTFFMPIIAMLLFFFLYILRESVGETGQGAEAAEVTA